MAELTTFARPYAKAAFEYAKNIQQLTQWSQMLNLAAVVSAHEGVRPLLKKPRTNPTAKAEAFLEVCADSLDKPAQNFIQVLAEHNRLVLLPEIAGLFELLKAEQEKIVEVQVISAFALTEQQQEQLIEVLRARLGREVRLTVVEDASLIGGVLIHAGDLVIDGSVRGKIAKLAEAMIS